ncbi:hypothetical protein ACHAPA_007679 [Fusarium lateritium]
MVGGTPRQYGSPGSSTHSSGDESAAGSEWDVIAWSEQHSPIPEHFSVRIIKESELTMNRDTRDSLCHTENSVHDEDKYTSSANTNLQQQEVHPGAFSYLDLSQSELLGDCEHFDFDAFTNSTSNYHLHEPDPPSNDFIQVTAPSVVLPTLNPPIYSSGALFDQAPGLVDPSSLDLSGTTNAQPTINPILREWISLERTVSSRETRTIAEAAPGDLTRYDMAGSNDSIAGPSTRRRPRSPSPEDIQKRMAPSMFCFRMEFPDSHSSRPAKKMRRPNDEQRRREIAEVRQKGACLRCRLQKLKVSIANGFC